MFVENFLPQSHGNSIIPLLMVCCRFPVVIELAPIDTSFSPPFCLSRMVVSRCTIPSIDSLGVYVCVVFPLLPSSYIVAMHLASKTRTGLADSPCFLLKNCFSCRGPESVHPISRDSETVEK
eukprot:TRINITY_DN22359_c0_g1_i4.p1 TRINITY_DN22359_c0_g1~~TRINITY_DN22359_c0_g1_i4.p1  ORF type:complete len:122 (-),score=0.14 TRINITY_DN22359_c0_g1_i4:76-441(-)